jgi:hypothetical protein
MSTISNILDHYFAPVTPMLTREMAEAIVNRKPDEHLAERVLELGRKSDNGSLTEDERAEYKDLVDAGDLVALLKAKARQFLADHPG